MGQALAPVFMLFLPANGPQCRASPPVGAWYRAFLGVFYVVFWPVYLMGHAEVASEFIAFHYAVRHEQRCPCCWRPGSVPRCPPPGRQCRLPAFLCASMARTEYHSTHQNQTQTRRHRTHGQARTITRTGQELLPRPTRQICGLNIQTLSGRINN